MLVLTLTTPNQLLRIYRHLAFYSNRSGIGFLGLLANIPAAFINAVLFNARSNRKFGCEVAHGQKLRWLRGVLFPHGLSIVRRRDR